MRGFVGSIVGLCAIQLFNLVTPTQVAAANKTAQEITGTVSDTLGRPLDRVDLLVQRQDGVIVARARSDKNGHFQFANIRRGTYVIVANKQGFATATSVVNLAVNAVPPVRISMAAQTALSMQVIAQRLEAARNGLSPETGSSVYRFSQKAIEQLPQGSNTQMTNVLVQAPGVAQDSFGQVHIRGEHAELQYRINGIELPEGISSGFSQTFSPRFAQSISLLEGALPAQYGYHTAGVVQIRSKSGESLNGGDVEMYGGQRGTLQPNFELGGTKGNLSYYTTGFYLQNNRGLEPPTPGPEAIHDFATIGNAFSYLSYFLSATTRVSLVSGFNLSNFEIPANPDQPPAFSLFGVSSYPSAKVRETQLEQNYYGVLALQGLLGSKIDYQVAAFSRYSTLSFHPDQTGDLVFNGIASRIFRGDWANGLQGDAAFHGIADHTIRGGFYFQGERAEIDNHALVFPGGPGGQTSTHPEAIVDDGALVAWLYSLYMQDEWKPIRKLTINYGVRFDLYDGITRSDQFSPRIGAVYQLLEKTALHAAYARYFTPPPLEAVSGEDIKKFLGTTNQPLVLQNGKIAPERAHYFDAGATQNLPYGLKVDVDTYFKIAHDLIDEGQFGPTLIFTPFNYETGRQYGVEFSASLNRENLSAYSNFAYSVAQGTNIKSDQFLFGPDELAFINNHYVFLDHDQTFSASWGVAYNVQGWLFSIDGFYGSGLRTGFANTGNQPFYIQFDAAIAKRLTLPTIGQVEGRVVAVNLGDWIYQLRSGSGIGVFAPQFGPRRAVLAGLKWYLPWSKN